MAKYDASKYKVSEDMPKKFATVIKGLGIQHFDKDYLTNNDCKALVMSGNEFVKQISDDASQYAQDKPEYHSNQPRIKDQ